MSVTKGQPPRKTRFFANFQRIPRNVWVLGFVSLLTDISSETVNSLLPLFLVSTFNSGVLTIGIIEGMAEATAAIFKLFSGVLSDYFRRRKSLAVLGYGLSTLVKPLFALATNSAWILAARFGDRVGKGIRVAPRDALVADDTPEEIRGTAYGLRQSLDTIGAFLGPLLAFGLMAASGNNFRFVFCSSLAPGVIAVILLALGVRERTRQVQQQKRQVLNWKILNRLDRKYWTLVAVTLLFNLGNSSNAFLLLRASGVGIADAFVPLTLLVMNCSYCFSAYPAGVLSDYLGRVKLLITGFALYALIYLGFAFAQTQWQIWGLFALYGLHLGISKGVLSALIADRVPKELRGTGFGFINLATGIALLFASLIAGGLWQYYGASATFITGSIFALTATVMLIWEERQP